MLATSLYANLKQLENSIDQLKPTQITDLVTIIETEVKQINTFLKNITGDNWLSFWNSYQIDNFLQIFN